MVINEMHLQNVNFPLVPSFSPMDALIYFGGEVKALDDSGRVGGYLVRFTDAQHKDLVGDYFTKDTYLGARSGDGVDCLFHHGLPLKAAFPAEFSDHLFAPLKTKVDDIGVFAETVLDLADAYEKKIHELVIAGKLGWSSGAPPHMVKRAEDGFLKRWPIAEGSLTPMPCEPQNRALAMKSFDSIKLIDIENDDTIKDLFSDKLAEQTPSSWQLESAFRDVLRDIASAAATSNVTGTPVDVQAKVREAADGYLAKLVPLAVSQINDYVESGDPDPFYLKSVLHELPDTPAVPKFVESLEVVLAAAQEVQTRAKLIHELRVKSGRVLSEANRQRLSMLLTGLQTCASDIESLLTDTEAQKKSIELIDPDIARGLVVGFELQKMRMPSIT